MTRLCTHVNRERRIIPEGVEGDSPLKKLTPVYVVDRIEHVLEFWVDRLGFAKFAEVPEGDSLGFVVLVKDQVEIMYQSLDSVRKDIPALADPGTGGYPPNATYIEVAKLDEIIALLGDWPVLVPKRTTFYGAIEIGVREPGGNLIMFAEQPSRE
jgi:hypothetical protein